MERRIENALEAEAKRYQFMYEEAQRFAEMAKDEEAFAQKIEGQKKMDEYEAKKACEEGHVITSAFLSGAYTIVFDGKDFHLMYKGEEREANDYFYFDASDNMEYYGYYIAE